MGTVRSQRRARLRRQARQTEVAAGLARLVQLLETARACGGVFGRFLDCGLVGRGGVTVCATRDVLPLPWASASTLELRFDTSQHCRGLLLSLVNGTVAGLNFQFSNLRAKISGASASGAQRAVFANLGDQWWRLGAQLSRSTLAPTPGSAYRRLVSKGSCPKAVPLRADRVDIPPACSRVDPSPFLPPDVRRIACDPELLFPDGVEAVRMTRFSAGARAEYVLLLRRQIRVGKIRLTTHANHVSSVFAVGKQDGDRLREVWDGGPLSRCAAPPPKAPYLANPAALTGLECSDDLPLWVSTRDGACFFDQLRLPSGLVAYTGRPAVTVQELCLSQYHGAADHHQHVLSSTELRAALYWLMRLPCCSAFVKVGLLHTTWCQGRGKRVR